MDARAIYCPNLQDHTKHRKILVLVSEKELYLNCRNHGWMKIEFSKAGRKINFQDVAVNVVAVRGKPHFDITDYPVLTEGTFPNIKNG